MMHGPGPGGHQKTLSCYFINPILLLANPIPFTLILSTSQFISLFLTNSHSTNH